MKYLLFFLFLFVSNTITAQYTLIPDINFEKALISQGIDNGIPDGKVLTSSINKLQHLSISKEYDFYNKIKDLTGIQDFLELRFLDCSYNELTSLDVSKNLALTTLYCQNNFLSSLDILKNIHLGLLTCSDNNLTALNVFNNLDLKFIFCEQNNLKKLDVSNNVKLMDLFAGYNQLTNLDLSKNINLQYLTCNDNLLISLNLKNGNNTILQYNNPFLPNINLRRNPNLLCISVDDVTYSNANWSALKDPTASYTTTENLVPIITSPQFFCSANNQTLADITIISGTNLTWHNASIGGNTLLNISILVDGETYYASQNSSGCESARTPVKILIGDSQAPLSTLLNLPDIKGDCHTAITTIPTATDTCAGAITATTASPLTYSLPGTYTVIWDYNDGNGNISHQNQTVTISSQPLPTATTPQTFCIQQNATINDIATTTGQNVKWYDALTAGNLLLNTTVLQDGKIYYASQTINSCESERIPVKVNIQNTQAPTGNANQNFCTGQNPTLGDLKVVGTNLKWYGSATLGNILADTTPLVNGKTYYATQTENNCESSNRLAVTVSLINSLPGNDYAFSICDDLNDGKETVKLEDYNSNLISNTPNYNFSYYKTLSDAENEVTNNKITTVSSYKLILGENNIYVRINSNTPCYAIAVLKITLFSKPIIAIQDIVPICENKSTIVDAGSGADSYAWSNGKTTQTITVNNSGDLSVNVKKNHGSLSCSSAKSFTVKTSNIAKITSIETSDWTNNDNTITVFVTGSGDFEYSIDGLNYQDSNTFSGVHSGEYMVQVRDKNGCGTATEEVYLVMYPKFFTPNGDGFNDTWKIKSTDTEKGMTIKIFDRFGKLLKELDSTTNGWDGTYIGQTLPATDYWFVITRANGKIYKGHFSLKR